MRAGTKYAQVVYVSDDGVLMTLEKPIGPDQVESFLADADHQHLAAIEAKLRLQQDPSTATLHSSGNLTKVLVSVGIERQPSQVCCRCQHLPTSSNCALS